MNFRLDDLMRFGYTEQDEASYERACRLIVEEKVREAKAEEYAARSAKAEAYAARIAKAKAEAEASARDVPAVPRCPIILIADQEYRRGDCRHFSRRSNLAGWDGVRVSSQPECGGGRQIIRKAITRS